MFVNKVNVDWDLNFDLIKVILNKIVGKILVDLYDLYVMYLFFNDYYYKCK